MSCDTFKPLLMGYLDEELTGLEALRVERHLQGCGNCSRELQEFRKLKEVTDDMRVIVPEDKYWDQYWSNVYNRLERKIGWILLSMGSIVLLAYAIYTLGETFIFGKHIPLLVRVGVIALVGGLCTLLISVLRERWFISKSDKYERIRR
jgi:predicted anti-sigma-YlaC factor YlaD